MLQSSLLPTNMKTQLHHMIMSHLQQSNEKTPSTQIKTELPGYQPEVGEGYKYKNQFLIDSC